MSAFVASVLVSALIGATVNIAGAIAGGATLPETAWMGVIGFATGAVFGAALGVAGAIAGGNALATVGAYLIGATAGAGTEMLNTTASSYIVGHRSPTGEELGLAAGLGILNGLASVGLGQLLLSGLSQTERLITETSFVTQVAYGFTVSRPLSYLNWSIELAYSSYVNNWKKKSLPAYFLNLI